MPQSPFVSIETLDGIVVHVDGDINGNEDNWKVALFGGAIELKGKRINDALTACAEAGYELFLTETIGKKIVYRLKLSLPQKK